MLRVARGPASFRGSGPIGSTRTAAGVAQAYLGCLQPRALPRLVQELDRLTADLQEKWRKTANHAPPHLRTVALNLFITTLIAFHSCYPTWLVAISYRFFSGNLRRTLQLAF